MGPDYSNYSKAELEEALSSIDKERYPKRLGVILYELQKRNELEPDTHKVNQGEISLPDVNGLNKATLLELRSNGKSNRLISYWYAIAGGYTADEKLAKFSEVTATFRGKPEASIIAIAVDYNGNKHVHYVAQPQCLVIAEFYQGYGHSLQHQKHRKKLHRHLYVRLS